MKRLTITLLLIVACAAAFAQKGLSISTVFEGQIVPKKQMIESEIHGSQLRAYNLTLFHSVKFNATDDERDKVEQTVAELIPNALELEQEKLYDHLYYAVMTLEAVEKGAPRRFVCYQCAKAKGGTFSITLVYMEGRATLEQLRKTFKKN